MLDGAQNAGQSIQPCHPAELAQAAGFGAPTGAIDPSGGRGSITQPSLLKLNPSLSSSTIDMMVCDGTLMCFM